MNNIVLQRRQQRRRCLLFCRRRRILFRRFCVVRYIIIIVAKVNRPRRLFGPFAAVRRLGACHGPEDDDDNDRPFPTAVTAHRFL